MSAVHRIENMYEMDAKKFFSFAQQLISYKGAVRCQAEVESEEERQKNNPEKRKPVKDSNQWFLERRKAKEQKSVHHDPGIDPAIAAFMERGTG